jgi:hypothetical protein
VVDHLSQNGAPLSGIPADTRSTPAVSNVVDAYNAAALSLPAIDARAARLALLDANGEGNFDHLDLQIFRDKLSKLSKDNFKVVAFEAQRHLGGHLQRSMIRR